MPDRISKRLVFLLGAVFAAEFTLACIYGLRVGGADEYFLRSALFFAVNVLITMLVLRVLPQVINLERLPVLSVAVVLKIAFSILVLFTYLLAHNSFFLNVTGDDHEYYHLAKMYSGDFSRFVYEESDNYAFPYASVALIVESYLGNVQIIRLLQLLSSCFTCVLFYRVLGNLGFESKIRNATILLFILAPAPTFYSMFIYKDTLVMLCISAFLVGFTDKRAGALAYGLMGAALLVGSYFRGFLAPVFVFLLLVNTWLARSDQQKTLARAIRASLLTAAVFVIFIFFFSGLVERTTLIFDLMEIRLTAKQEEFGGAVNLSLPRLLLTSVFAFNVVPPVFSDFATNWSNSEGFLAFSRSYNFAISIFMFAGIFWPVERNRKWLIFILSLSMLVLGMAFVGQTLSDRHKLMMYPFVYILVAFGIQRLNALKTFNYNVVTFIAASILLLVQYGYMELRLGQYGL